MIKIQYKNFSGIIRTFEVDETQGFTVSRQGGHYSCAVPAKGTVWGRTRRISLSFERTVEIPEILQKTRQDAKEFVSADTLQGALFLLEKFKREKRGKIEIKTIVNKILKIMRNDTLANLKLIEKIVDDGNIVPISKNLLSSVFKSAEQQGNQELMKKIVTKLVASGKIGGYEALDALQKAKPQGWEKIILDAAARGNGKAINIAIKERLPGCEEMFKAISDGKISNLGVESLKALNSEAPDLFNSMIDKEVANFENILKPKSEEPELEEPEDNEE